jgi:hypothetical protein
VRGELTTAARILTAVLGLVHRAPVACAVDEGVSVVVAGDRSPAAQLFQSRPSVVAD